jgi:ribosomal protein S18 acetylase RimI-like enzyme
MDPLRIRRMRPGERAAVVALWRRAREQAMPALEARMAHSEQDDLRFFAERLVREHEVFVAVREGRPVGLLALAPGTVGQLHVDPPAQGQGVGSALLELARQRSPAGLSLFTHQANRRARAFYERRGFRAVRFGTSPPPESEPDVEYRWDPGGNSAP